jgi:ribosomal protein L23
MNKERLMTVLIQPHVSEKAATVTEKANQYVFRVRDDASKAEVKQAVELMFEVKVEGVNRTFGNRAVHRLHRRLASLRINRPWHSLK